MSIEGLLRGIEGHWRVLQYIHIHREAGALWVHCGTLRGLGGIIDHWKSIGRHRVAGALWGHCGTFGGIKGYCGTLLGIKRQGYLGTFMIIEGHYRALQAHLHLSMGHSKTLGYLGGHCSH